MATSSEIERAPGRAAREGRPGPLLRARGPRTLAVGAAGVAVWLLGGLGAKALRTEEERLGIVSGRPSEGEAIASVLGGFRGIASDFLWLRAIQMRDEGRFDEITLLCRLILDLQPRFTGVWTFHSWNLAYNLAYDSNTPEERWRWIRQGTRLLEEEGIERNPNSWEIPWELGTTYFFRVSRKGRDPFHRHYQERLAPVPDWCREGFEFVDRGLWSDRRVRYRLYKREVEAGRATLGGASAEGGYETRAGRMYVVLVRPGEALARAERLAGGGPHTELGSARLEPGAPLYADAPDRVAAEEFPPLHPGEEAEPPVPKELEGAAVVLLPEADRGLETASYVALELARPAEVWVGWVPDEARSFLIAREWILRAERTGGWNLLVVPRLRVHALVEAGRWEKAYEEFGELVRTVPPEDDATRNAFFNFLCFAVYERTAFGDREGAERWYARLRASFPSWRMSPEETVESAARALGLPFPVEGREKRHR